MNSENKRKIWKIKYNVPEIPAELLEAGYTPLLSSLLALRGITTEKEAKLALFSGTEALHDPFAITGMAAAVERIQKAIDSGEKIAVYGDYDVDGITATCIVTDYLLSLGAMCFPYIPDREEEGYGLNCEALDNFRASGISLLITVDCGITAIEEAQHAKKIGIDMVITDHHECKPGVLPEAVAVADCRIPGNRYENPELAGVGMAFKLVCACAGKERKTEMLEKYSDLVAIGTVADVMPLTGENRYLVQRGLEKIRTSPRPGIAAMLKDASLDAKSVNSSTISFTISPRINAAGRLGQAITAVELILAEDSAIAEKISADLCELNRKRQTIENEIWQEAEKMVESRVKGGSPVDSPIVLSHSSWHQGVIGIAASRLAEKYSMPTIMICMNGAIGKGSCRSYGGFNLFEALQACSEHLVSFGGHALAAGLNIDQSHIESFTEALAKYYRENPPVPCPDVDCSLLITDPELLSEQNVRSLERLEPFGNGNPKPLMCVLGVKLNQATNVGGGKHLKMDISIGDRSFDAIFFSHTAESLGIHDGDVIDVAFSPTINEFRGHTSVQLSVSAVRKHDGYAARELCENIIEKNCSYLKAVSTFIPERPDFVRVWKMVSARGAVPDSMDSLMSSCPEDLIHEKFCLCLRVFREAGLLAGEKIIGSRPKSLSEKADLEATSMMRKLRTIHNSCF